MTCQYLASLSLVQSSPSTWQLQHSVLVEASYILSSQFGVRKFPQMLMHWRFARYSPALVNGVSSMQGLVSELPWRTARDPTSNTVLG